MRFLCLHGRATSAKIFEMQTERIREGLTEHEFSFLNGDIPVEPDSTAASQNWNGGLYGYLGDTNDVNQYQDLLDGLVNVVQLQGPFDGIMGFSEGGIVAATLLLEDAQRPFANFKCGIFFSAAPPLDPDGLRAGIVRCLDPAKDAVAINVPTAHIYSLEKAMGGLGSYNVQSPLHGLWNEAGWSLPGQSHSSLAQLCDKSQVVVHGLGHHVPGARDREALRGTLRAIDRIIQSAKDEN